jgi:hypothetical protein
MFQVLLIGGTDFTLLGRPILPNDLVHVEATVVEKTLSHTKTVFRKKRRKQYMRTNCKYIKVLGFIYVYLIYYKIIKYIHSFIIKVFLHFILLYYCAKVYSQSSNKVLPLL